MKKNFFPVIITLLLSVMSISAQINITTTALPNGAVGTLYSATFAASGLSRITWSITAGALPGGLRLNASRGVITGTPTAAGTFNFTVMATYGANNATKPFSIVINPSMRSSATYADLMMAVQGETNANAHYAAFAAKAKEERYYEIANLFTATAAAEAIHATFEWNMLMTMGATAAEKPVADTPVVGTTAENLQAAIDGETYEYTTMYPGFAADATAEGYGVAASLFAQTGRVENIHANNFSDALANLNDAAYLSATFATTYLCPACGAVFDAATLPASGRCTVCGTSQSLYVQYVVSRTYADLMMAVQGETNANAHYTAFAAKANEDGYPEIASLFTATAAAEAIHATSEWNMLMTMGATAAEKPVADTPTVGTTAENLQAAIDGETYEYTTMYPGFAADATAEGNNVAASLFTRTGRVENIHANNFSDALANLNDAAYLSATFATIYLCPVCGAVFDAATLPASARCPVCGTNVSISVIYDTTTGIISADIQNLNIFPNPAKEELCITAESQINKVEIYDMDGKMLMQENNFAGKMNVSSLAKGMYIVKIYINGEAAVRKMIKN